MRSISIIRSALGRTGPLLAALLLIVFGLPLAVSLFGALSGPAPESLVRMAQTVLPGYAVTTIIAMILAGAIGILIGAAGAFVVTFHELPFRNLIDAAFVLPLALPPYLVGIVYREVMGSPAQSLWGLALVLAVTSYPYVYLLTRITLRRQSALYIENAACLGISRSRALRRVILPLAIPPIALGGALICVESVSDFGAAYVLSVDTMTSVVRRALFSAFDTQLALQLALLTSVAPLAIAGLYWVLVGGRSFVASGNRPKPVPRSPLPKGLGGPVVAACLLAPVAGFFFPVAVLLVWAPQAFARIDLSDLLSEAGATVGLSALVAAFAALISIWVSVLIRQQNGNGLRVGAIGVLAMNLALPSIVVGVSLLVLTGWGMDLAPVRWMNDTIIVLCAALVIKYTAFVFFGAESALATVSTRMDEAGLAVGRSRGYVARRVLAPLSRDGVIVGAALAFLIAAKELTLSLTLHPFGFKSLAMSTFHLAKVDAFPQAAVMALCLTAICLYPVLSLHRWALR